MKTELLSTAQSRDLLFAVRKNDSFSDDELNSLSHNDRAYLQSEIAIRKAKYNSLEEKLQGDVSPWVRELCICYRDLFSNPNKALSMIDGLIKNCPDGPTFKFRLKIWRAHLWLLTGEVAKGDSALTRLKTIIPSDYFWQTEILVVTALGHYFAGRMKESIEAHSSRDW